MEKSRRKRGNLDVAMVGQARALHMHMHMHMRGTKKWCRKETLLREGEMRRHNLMVVCGHWIWFRPATIELEQAPGLSSHLHRCLGCLHSHARRLWCVCVACTV